MLTSPTSPPRYSALKKTIYIIAFHVLQRGVQPSSWSLGNNWEINNGKRDSLTQDGRNLLGQWARGGGIFYLGVLFVLSNYPLRSANSWGPGHTSYFAGLIFASSSSGGDIFGLLHINNIYHWCQGQEAGEED